jgi:hypothetical protein
MLIYFVEYHHLDQEKLQGTLRVVESLFTHKHTSTKVENSNEDVICFKNYFIPKNIII